MSRRRERAPEPVQALLRRVLQGAPAAAGSERPADPRLLAAFRAAAGGGIAAHARPRFLKDGVLRVLVDSPVWLQELTFLRAELAAKIGRALGKPVRELALSLERRPLPPLGAAAAPAATPAPSPLPELSAAARAELEEESRPLAADPELRDAFVRALTRWRARHPPSE